jgi:hypothetical protein
MSNAFINRGRSDECGTNYFRAFFFFSFYWARVACTTEVLQPAGLMYEPEFGSSSLYNQEYLRLKRRERPLAVKG